MSDKSTYASGVGTPGARAERSPGRAELAPRNVPLPREEWLLPLVPGVGGGGPPPTSPAAAPASAGGRVPRAVLPPHTRSRKDGWATSGEPMDAGASIRPLSVAPAGPMDAGASIRPLWPTSAGPMDAGASTRPPGVAKAALALRSEGPGLPAASSACQKAARCGAFSRCTRTVRLRSSNSSPDSDSDGCPLRLYSLQCCIIMCRHTPLCLLYFAPQTSHTKSTPFEESESGVDERRGAEG
jgi:hypothetical protein